MTTWEGDDLGYINLASVRLCTESEGPGKRLALWVQGCRKRCFGCCNPEMQEIKRNIVIDTKDIINMICQSKKDNDIEGISFIGGEPFLQAGGLSEIAKWAKNEGLSVLVFSGYLLKELNEMGNPNVELLLQYTDILIDGPFIQERYDNKRDWVGSTNQKIHFLSNTYQNGIEYQNHYHQMEVLVSENDILINGWPYF